MTLMPHFRSILILSWLSNVGMVVNGFDLSARRRGSNPKAPVSTIDRRSAILIGCVITGSLISPQKARAANDSEKNDFIVDGFKFSIPSNWKVTSKPQMDASNTDNKSKSEQKNPKLFSAIDFQSGSVITVVRERACNAQEFAQSADSCDVLIPSGHMIFSDDTIAKDISKLLLRHDDRDNAVLQGTTRLDSYEYQSNSNTLDVGATTTLPSVGTYRDSLGIDRQNTLDRKLKAKSLLQVSPKNENEEKSLEYQAPRILTLWLSAPVDEWQKPVMGTKLNQVWESIKVI
mmetsp:Transcript_28113/g.64335  ORF Transcript_28113/g.64335 Transcript_28113/m.64335 type:complete len:289 (-) Transcript_28113:103-969(-)